MSVGYSIGKGDVDLMLGSVAVNTRDILAHGKQVITCLANITDTQLANMGYSPADITLIRNVASDIANLESIITGAMAQPTVYDFTANLKQLYGAN